MISSLSLLLAQASSTTGGGGAGSLLVPVVCFGIIFYFGILRPQQKRHEGPAGARFFAEDRRQGGHQRRHSRDRRQCERRRDAQPQIADNVRIEVDKTAIASVDAMREGSDGASGQGGLISRSLPLPAMPEIATFLFGLLLLILFGWYIFSDAGPRQAHPGHRLSVLLIAFCLQLVYPALRPSKTPMASWCRPGKISLGLDLRGGTSFLIRLAPAAGEKGAGRARSPRTWWSRRWRRSASASIRWAFPSRSSRRKGRTASWCRSPGSMQEKIDDAREQLQQVAKLEFRLVHPQGARDPRPAQAPWDPDYVKAKEKLTRGTARPIEHDDAGAQKAGSHGRPRDPRRGRLRPEGVGGRARLRQRRRRSSLAN